MSNPARKTILVVDDDANFRNLLTYLLGRSDFKILQADNGQLAMEQLARPEGRPDLIILDLNMPVMDGRKFRELQLRDPQIASIPVLVITSAMTPDTEISAVRAAGVLRKPIQADRLAELVSAYLPKG